MSFLLLLLLLCAGCSFASAAGHVEVFRHNIFIPHQQLKGKFNKVGRQLHQQGGSRLCSRCVV
jgi:hypothetical protein